MFDRPDALLQTIADNASLALFITDARQHCVFMNPAAEALTGYRLHEVQGRPLHDVVHHQYPDGRPYPLDACPIDRAFPERNRMRGEEVFIHKDGHFYEVAFTASPVRNEQGAPVGTIIEVQDISDRRALQAREIRAQQLFVDLVEGTPFGLYIVDADFRMALMNGGARATAFRNIPEVVGTDFRDVVRQIWPESVAQEVIGHFRRVLETGEPYHSSEFRNPRRDVDAIEAYEFELQRITLPDGRRGVACYYFDSTQLRDAEMALRREGQRKDEFLAVLAHELRNPLAPIRTAVALQRTRPVTDPLLNRCRDVIDRQVSHMSRLIDDLLDVSRLGRGKLVLQREHVTLDSVLESALETSRPEIDRYHCDLVVHAASLDHVQLDADSARLSQVFANLLNNAAKYNRPSGSVVLTVYVDQDRSEAVVTVADSGCGIAPEFMPRLFQLFEQGQRAPGTPASGLGIGLHLSKQLVELHGGQIAATSGGEGQGSQFVVRLPVVVSISVPVAATPELSPTLSAPLQMRVLVADDNPDGAEMLTEFLRQAGCEVIAVADGPAAVQAAENLRPDAAVLDIGMPGLDGYEVCARIRAAAWGKSMQVLALTGWGQPLDKERADAAGFDLHLVKPIDPHNLLTELRRLQSLSPVSTARPV
ncbi:MAG: ATP-binding protein [Vicinamibacterales bacterium]